MRLHIVGQAASNCDTEPGEAHEEADADSEGAHAFQDCALGPKLCSVWNPLASARFEASRLQFIAVALPAQRLPDHVWPCPPALA